MMYRGNAALVGPRAFADARAQPPAASHTNPDTHRAARVCTRSTYTSPNSRPRGKLRREAGSRRTEHDPGIRMEAGFGCASKRSSAGARNQPAQPAFWRTTCLRYLAAAGSLRSRIGPPQCPRSSGRSR